MTIKTWPLSRPFQVVGEETHLRFAALPAHDHAAFYNYLQRTRSTLKPAVMVDIGADMGTGALAFCDAVWGVPVIAFEPDPALFCWLKETIALNGLGQCISLFEKTGTEEAVSTALETLDGGVPNTAQVLLHTLSTIGPPLGLEKLARDGSPPPCVFFRLNIGHVTAAGRMVADVLQEAECHLGPLGVVDELTGVVSALASGKAGAAQLRALERSPFEVFSLVNRLDVAELEQRPPWTRQDVVAANQGKLETVQSSGVVVDDFDVADEYAGAVVRSFTSRHWPLKFKRNGATSKLTVFPVKGLTVTSCYLSLDPTKNRLFGNQSYYDAGLWFTLKPRISGDNYDFRSRAAVPIPGRTVVIGGPIDGAYYHWLLNWAPRLVLLDLLAADIAADPDIKFLIDHRAQSEPFAAVLNALGVNPDRIVWAEDRLDYVLEEGVLVSFPSQTTYYPDLIKAFVERVRGGLPKQHLSARKRLWISRQKFDRPKRRIANMPEIESLLHDYGFEEVVLEDLPVAEQIAAFSNAEMIAGVHGAGLANLIFCPADCKVVLMETDYSIREGTGGMFSVLAKVLGLSYEVVRVREHRLRGIDYSFRGNRHNCDVDVPVGLLRGALKKLAPK